ncbi:hypothetical protein STCU_00937 [Strigomonas culicis]|uniref:Uncharacterized protein n=1 Tax=Strigomonas culicis TaxID=28005 RepID=S9UY03_9TRYP|nr:hypothetical protein STCU_00937 [Strigomonas culicis]|eukprot:EPY35737.1 hypothetical protein STCU_00937 [Strigomonas culicis]
MTAAIPISIIDYSIMARVAGVTDSSMKELLKGIRTVLTRPHKFFLPCAENKCALVYAVCATTYGWTYIGSNCTKSYLESQQYSAAEFNFAAGIVSGVINTVLTIWKDSVILRALPPVGEGALTANKKVPFFTRALFCGRDTLTCLAAFTIAPMLAGWMSERYYHHKRIGGQVVTLPEDEGKTHLPLSTADTAQIVTPALLQFLTTLLHITAIRYRQTYPKFDMGDLKDSLRKTYISSTLLRMCRIIPAFGIGGIMNREVRSNLLDKAEPTIV